jgi:uncharacterized membrane-anchored protein YhcB (DUF1043 family)
MVFYNRILRMWVLDTLDYLLIGVIIGNLVAYYAKNRLSKKLAEKEAME